MNYDNQQPDPTKIPRYCGVSTYARLNILNENEFCDIAVVGIPFDSGVTFRPGARFGPESIRSASRLIRQFNINQSKSPFKNKIIKDAGDIACNPFNIHQSLNKITKDLDNLLINAKNLVIFGGDHTISYPILRSMEKKYGKVALLHFDSHFDTWDEYFGEKCTHGTPFKRALEEDLIDVDHSMHVGIHGTINDYADIENDKKLGFKTIFTNEIDTLGLFGVIDKILSRIGNTPCYVSIDIDCVDPAYAPGTGTPEPGGLTSRELFNILKGLSKLNIIGGDIVEVSPSYDANNITSQLAAHLGFELLCLIK
jgi:agmatinase